MVLKILDFFIFISTKEINKPFVFNQLNDKTFVAITNSYYFMNNVNIINANYDFYNKKFC